MLHIVPSNTLPTPLARYLPRALDAVPGWAVRQVLRTRQVKRDGKRLSTEDLVVGGDRLVVYFPKGIQIRTQPLSVLYADDRAVIVEKTQGMGVSEADGPGGAVEVILAEQLGLPRVWACHRLDYYTGGLLLLAKEEEAFHLLCEDFTQHRIKKGYICRVLGTPGPRADVLHAYLRKDAGAAKVEVRDAAFPGAKPITTGYRVLEDGTITRLAVDLVTGRTHQIRAHLAHIGHPILGDDKYGDREANHRHGVMRQQLWATSLCFAPDVSVASLRGLTITCGAPF